MHHPLAGSGSMHLGVVSRHAGLGKQDALLELLAVGLALVVGQAANSQFGPVLPTLVPSGQIFASWVQATNEAAGKGPL